MKTPLVPCRSYQRYIICRLMAEIRYLVLELSRLWMYSKIYLSDQVRFNSMEILKVIREVQATIIAFYVSDKCKTMFIFSVVYRNSKHRQLICYLMKDRDKFILHGQCHCWWWYQWPWCCSMSPRVCRYLFDGTNVLDADGSYVWYSGKCLLCLHILSKTCYWYQQLSLQVN